MKAVGESVCDGSSYLRFGSVLYNTRTDGNKRKTIEKYAFARRVRKIKQISFMRFFRQSIIFSRQRTVLACRTDHQRRV